MLDRGIEQEAIREWRRIRGQRSTAPNEALAAAIFESARGRANNAIRILRNGFPELGGISIADLPINVLQQYLPLRWPDELAAAAREAGVDPWLLAGLARQESLFVPHARSPRGAIGLLQLIPTTASVHSRRLGLGTRPDLLDPALNLRLGALELASLIDSFHAVEPALAAYNAGFSRSKRWWKRAPDHRHFTEAVPIPETYTYIRRVVFLSEAYRQVYAEHWRKP